MKFYLRRYLAIVQVVVSSSLILIGVAFPLYILIKYGSGVHKIYDRQTQSFVEYNYLLYSIAMACIFIAVGTFCLVLAVQYLKNIPSHRDRP